MLDISFRLNDWQQKYAEFHLGSRMRRENVLDFQKQEKIKQENNCN